MGSEQKPKEIKIKLSIDVEDAKKKKWNELTLKEKGIQISWCIFSLSLFAEVLLCIIVSFTGVVNVLVIYSASAIFVVLLIAVIYLAIYDETFVERLHTHDNTDWDS
jgi:hypothetical protein|uniref:hypothetical protein n=1 Tax=Alloprevotella sp. TaxID=1872471 RepID=UPI0040267C40